MNSLIKIAVVLAFAAVASGNLPAVINKIRKAQFQLNQESKASNWPRAMTLPSRQFTVTRFQRQLSGTVSNPFCNGFSSKPPKAYDLITTATILCATLIAQALNGEQIGSSSIFFKKSLHQSILMKLFEEIDRQYYPETVTVGCITVDSIKVLKSQDQTS